MAQRTAISRRQFLTGAFRGRDASSSEAGAALPRDLTRGMLGESGSFEWSEEQQVPDWENSIDSVLEEMANLKGIEDF